MKSLLEGQDGCDNHRRCSSKRRIAKHCIGAEPEEGRDSLRATRTGIARGTQDLRDIPQSVTVVTEKLMDDRNLDTLKEVLQNTAGFVYYVSVTGITGAAAAVATEVAPEVARIKRSTDLPVIVGFGINTPEAAQGIASVADGCVVGSAIVKRIGEGQSPAEVLAFVASLAAGAHSA